MHPALRLPTNVDEMPSPALVIDWPVVEDNLRMMVGRVASPDRLRPHVKTHKLPQLVEQLVSMGVEKAKCATIAEAEMAAGAGATDVLLAAPLVGPTIGRMLALMTAFPQVEFAGLVDDAGAMEAVASAATAAGVQVRVLLDLDVGQHRTGIPPERAAELYRAVAARPGLIAGGLHAYDGHLHQSDVAERAEACDAAYAPVEALVAGLRAEGLPVPAIVAGGTPTFPMHARRPEVECSPGTCVFWDAGYGRGLPDLDFQAAAVLLTRVISRPTANRICLDLGHKAVASEMPHPRAFFPALPDARAVMHNEEHMVIESDQASEIPVGTPLAAIPWHICPTVALHSFVHVMRDGRTVNETWPVTARTRRITC